MNTSDVLGKDMFSEGVYRERRNGLRRRMQRGLVLLLGNQESPINYCDNLYPFRQDSSFLYYLGISHPGIAALIDLEASQDVLYGKELSMEETVWIGLQPSLEEMGARAGVQKVAEIAALPTALERARRSGRPIHFLPPYRTAGMLKLHQLLCIPLPDVKKQASRALIEAVVAQRSLKSAGEVQQIETALATTRRMHIKAMQLTQPGLYELDIVSAMTSAAYSCSGARMAYEPVFTMRGDILHNHFQGNRMRTGDLVLNDAGAESPLHYAGDITRVIPVGGRFSEPQKAVYNLVLSTQARAIAAVKPGERFRDVHLAACLYLARGLKDLGLMKGDVEAAVRQGAHALFFPHGLGHMLGLDVHDMESLGEDVVGYGPDMERSTQFGLHNLRLARTLAPGFVLTVEPGVYFIPQLIDRWRREGRFKNFINWPEVEKYKGFGGVRIEDDVLVTGDGCRILGETIPKDAAEVEALAGSSTAV